MQGKIENLFVTSRKNPSGQVSERYTGPFLAKMHNSMETRVPSSNEEGTSPIAIAKPTNVHCHPEKLLHPPGCLVHVTLPKDHPEVKGSSLGARALEGIFFGNDPNSPLVRAHIPRLNRIVSANEVKIFPDHCPFLDPCMYDTTDFTTSYLTNLRVPLPPLATRKSERIAQIQEVNLPPPTSPPIVVTVGAQTQSDDNHTPPLKLTHEQYIHHIKDHVLADFVNTGQLQLHFPAGRFWEEKIGSWFMKCVGTEKLHDQRKHVTLEHISGDIQALTRQYQREKAHHPTIAQRREVKRGKCYNRCRVRTDICRSTERPTV
jgi:hypothetical protein